MIKIEKKFYCENCDYSKVLGENDPEPVTCPACGTGGYSEEKKESLMELFSMKDKKSEDTGNIDSDKKNNGIGFEFLWLKWLQIQSFI